MLLRLAVAVALCGFHARVVATQVSSWLTTADPETGDAQKLLEPQGPIEVGRGGTAQVQYNVDVSQTKQSILGYGAGLPQASASVLYNLKGRNPSVYSSVMQQLFGTANNGAAMNILRFPIGSCDFSMHNTSYDEHKDDYSLQYFAIDEDSKMIVSVLKDALAVNPNLVLIGKQPHPSHFSENSYQSITLLLCDHSESLVGPFLVEDLRNIDRVLREEHTALHRGGLHHICQLLCARAQGVRK
jgi:hypothetical protein